MRYIDKSNNHLEFDAFISEIKSRLSKWKDLKRKRNKAGVEGNDIQLQLFQHLWREQKGLCVYCQQLIPEKKAPYSNSEEIIAQIEHICPQSHCKDLIFNQSNLAVSCEGFNLSEVTPTPERRNFCGHFKDNVTKGNVYDSSKFLNPTTEIDIESYFSYSALGQIEANHLKNAEEQNQAEYMISTLGLDNPTLDSMRSSEYQIWLQEYLSKGEEWIKEQLQEDFDELPPFYSMLKSKFL